MTTCQEAAQQTAWDRHCDQALWVVAPPADAASVPLRSVELVAIEGTRPSCAPAGSRHPSLRGRKPEGAA